jgi:two-component system response regulator RegA
MTFVPENLEKIPQSKSEHLKVSLLIVDDDDTFRKRLAKAFSSRGYDVQVAADFDEAMTLCQQESPEWAILDLKMPKRSGLELLQAMLHCDQTIQILILTGYGSIATAIEAVKLGAIHYLTKPADVDEILAVFHQHNLHQHGHASPKTLNQDLNESLQQEVDLHNVPSLARVEWEHIQRVLNDVQGNISQASRLLGIHRRSLQRKLSKNPVNR